MPEKNKKKEGEKIMTKYSIKGNRINATTDAGAVRILARWVKAGKAAGGDKVDAYRTTDGQRYTIAANGDCVGF